MKYLDKAFHGGKIVDYKDATLPVATAAVQYGIGCFGGIRGYLQDDKRIGIFRLDDHVERLYKSAILLHFQTKFSKKDIKDAIVKTVEANKPKGDIYIRPFIYKSDTALGPTVRGEYELTVYCLSFDEYLSNDKGLSLKISSWIRIPDNAIPSRAKANGGYINASLAIEEAQSQGYDTAIMMDSRGHVAEGAVMNLFIVRDGEVITPSKDTDLLEGITRRTIIELAKEMKLPIIERSIARNELYISDEVFLSGTATGVAWVTKIDDRKIATKIGPVTKKLQARFKKLVAGKDSLSKDLHHYA